jgi:energy-converting hydrogenase Eha subunit E
VNLINHTLNCRGCPLLFLFYDPTTFLMCFIIAFMLLRIELPVPLQWRTWLTSR